MLHPFLKNSKSAFYYYLAWIIVSLIHFTMLNHYYDVPWQNAVTDALVFNVLFALVALGIWYVVRFADFEKENFLVIALNHIFTLVVLLPLWLFTGYFIVLKIFQTRGFDFASFTSTLPLRVISGIIYYLLVILCYYLIIYYQYFKNKLIKEASLVTQIKEAELNQLKSQIKPHFLFNSLNSISSLTLTNPTNAREMIIQLSDFLRYSIGNDEKQFVKLEEEINNIARYLSIEKVRFGNKIEFSREIDEECLHQALPNMILQPLVENSIKHGVYEATETVFIRIKAKKSGTSTIVSIFNNYDSESINKTGKGVGIQNIKNRLKIIYNRDDLLTIHHGENTFEVTLLIPEEEKKE